MEGQSNDNRTVKDIFNLVTCQVEEAQTIFQNEAVREAEIFQLRTKIQHRLKDNKPEYVCLYCKQPVVIRARLNTKHFYFAHEHDSDDCPFKTHQGRSEEDIRRMKYNGEKESQLHQDLKNAIGSYLEKTQNVTSVTIDKVYKDKKVSSEWRKPDVLATYDTKQIAFELQLTTTFLTVIVDRTRFYKQHGIYLIWVFADFSLNNDLQRFTQKDVYYNNNFNVYVFDSNARLRSQQENALYFTCYYKEFYSAGEGIFERWNSKFITLSDLNFDPYQSNVYYFNSSKQKAEVEQQIATVVRNRLETEEKDRIDRDVNKAAKYLKEFYSGDQPPENIWFPIDKMTSSKEVEALNQKLEFDGKNASFITNLFFGQKKRPNFLNLLATHRNIRVNTSLIHKNGVFAVEKVIDITERMEFERYCRCLFMLGYRLSDADREYLSRLYDHNHTRSTYAQKELIDRWALVQLLNNIDTREDIPLLFEYKAYKILMALGSLKFKIVLNDGFPTLKQVSHNILHVHPEFTLIYLTGLKAFNEYDVELRGDRKGKLKEKIDVLLSKLPPQNRKYNQIIYEVFPELYSVEEVSSEDVLPF